MPADAPTPPSASRSPLRFLPWLGTLVILGAAAWILRHYLSSMSWHDIRAAWTRLPPARIAGSVACTCVSFAMLAAFDVLAVRSAVPGRVPVWLAAFAGVVSNAMSNTLGFPALTGGAVRYRIYTAVGLTAGDIARIVWLAGMGVALGFVVVTTGALVWEPSIAHGWGRFPGVALVLFLVVGLAWLARKPRSLTIWRWTLIFPSAPVAGTQLLMGAVEMTAAISAFYILLPPESAPPFVDFLPIYVAAVLAGVVSHVPGGLGVFETIMIASFPPEARPDLLTALVCYRLCYGVLPLAVSLLSLGVFEFRRRHAGLVSSTAGSGE